MDRRAFITIVGGSIRAGPLTLEEFVTDPHGAPTRDATEPAWNGYPLTVACPCGVPFWRWVTPEDAAADLLHVAGLN